jgi:peroxiredoxin
MKKITSGLAFIVFALSACVGNIDAAPKPQEFRSEAGGFYVYTPASMTEEVQSVDVPNAGTIATHMFSGDRNNISYFVAYADFPEDLIAQSDPEKMLDGSVNGAVGNVNGVLVGQSKISLSGNPGREILANAKLPNGQDATLKAHIYLVQNRLYQVLILSLKGQVSNDVMMQYLDSFTLINAKNGSTDSGAEPTNPPAAVVLPPEWTKAVTATKISLTSTITPIEVRNKAPDFSGTTLDGAPFHLKDTSGHIVTLLFVTSTDSHCKKVAPLMPTAHAKFPPIIMVVIFEKDTLEAAQKFMTNYGLKFTAILDEKGSISSTYAVNGLPELITIYSDGIIHERFVGEFTQDKLTSILKKTT